MVAVLMLAALTSCAQDGRVASSGPPSSIPAGVVTAAPSATQASSSSVPAPKAVTVAKSKERVSDKNCKDATSGGRCPYVEITTTGMSGTVTCDIHDSAQGTWDSHAFLAPLTSVRYWYYGFAREVWVVCDGIESNKVSW
jgi:hypothetical protein